MTNEEKLEAAVKAKKDLRRLLEKTKDLGRLDGVSVGLEVAIIIARDQASKGGIDAAVLLAFANALERGPLDKANKDFDEALEKGLS